MQLILSTLLQVLIMHDVQPGHFLNITQPELFTSHYMSSAHRIFLPHFSRLMLWNFVGNRYRIFSSGIRSSSDISDLILLSHQQQLIVWSFSFVDPQSKQEHNVCTHPSLFVIYQIIESN